jgi:hypothetical protein
MWMGIAPSPTLFSQPNQPQPRPATPPAAGTPAATVGVKAPTPAPVNSCDGARDICSGACGKLKTRCEQGCRGKGKSATDRETCKLDCGESDGLCRADCVGDHATCVNGR